VKGRNNSLETDMKYKNKIYRSIISEGIAEVYSNVNNIQGFFPVSFVEVPEIQSTAKVNIYYHVENLPRNFNEINSIGKYYGDIDSDNVTRKFRLPFSKNAIIELSNLNKQPTLKINENYNRIGKFCINEFYPSGVHLRDLLSSCLINTDYIPVHSASFISDNNGIMLVANGGMGKTTILVKAIQQGYSFLSDDMTIIDKECNIYPCTGISSIAYESELKYLRDKSIKELILHIFPSFGLVYQRPYIDMHLINPHLKSAEKTKVCKVFILSKSKGNSDLVKLSKEQAYNLILKINRIEFTYSSNQMLLSYSLLNQWFDIQRLMQKEEEAIKNLVSNTDCYLSIASNPDEHFKQIQNSL
jgi:hypothetical protein